MALLTSDEWRAYKGKFHWMKVKENFSPIHLQIIEKWIDLHVTGWWYFDKEATDRYLYVFQNDSEMVAFKIWLSDRPFDKDNGDVDEQEVL